MTAKGKPGDQAGTPKAGSDHHVAHTGGSDHPAGALHTEYLNHVAPPGTGSRAVDSALAINGNKGHERVAATTSDGSATVEAKHFDRTKSVNDLVQSGDFKPAEVRAAKDAGEYPPLASGKAPNVTVQFENKDTNPDSKPPSPNYVVNKDGSITMMHNPEGPPPSANVVIEVARDKGQTSGPTKEQQAALDGLVNYTSQRIQDQYPNALQDMKLADGSTVKQVNISDNAHLVSDQVMQNFGNNIAQDKLAKGQAPQPEIPQGNSQEINNTMGRVQGSNGGREQIGAERSNGAFQDVPPPQPGDKVASMADTFAALSGADRQHPYQTIHQRNDGSYSVGRYGFNNQNLGHHFMRLIPADIMALLGDPPDWSKLAEILKDPKYAKEFNEAMDKAAKDGDLPQDLAKNMKDPEFAKGFGDFMKSLNGGGQPPSADQLNKFLPQGTQDALANSMVKSLAKEMGIDPQNMGEKDPGKLALGMFLGRAPNEQDMANPQAQKYMDAANNLYKVALARSDGPGNINITDANGKIVAQAEADLGKALWTDMGTGGNLGCAASVSKVLQQQGFRYAHSANVQGLEQQLLANGWKRIDHPVPGAVAAGYRGGGRHGHIGIVGADNSVYNNHSSSGRWSKDRLSTFYPGGSQGFSTVHWLAPPGSNG